MSVADMSLAIILLLNVFIPAMVWSRVVRTAAFDTSDILVVNDSSEDNTNKILKDINDKKTFLIERPTKLGLGSAHKLSLIYSIKKNYDFVLSMDADFSHHPKYIPNLPLLVVDLEVFRELFNLLTKSKSLVSLLSWIIWSTIS